MAGPASAINNLIKRGMIQCLSVPQKKMGAGKVVVCRRSPDLRLSDSHNYSHLPKIYNVISELEHSTTFYCGFDPTADSLHLGHMTVIAPLLHMAKHGYKVIALIGGSTSRLGDPSGKMANRQLIVNQQLQHNAVALESTLSKIFSNFSKQHTVDSSLFSVLNNNSWYDNMTFQDYMEEVAGHIKLNDMLSRSIVKSRLVSDNVEDDINSQDESVDDVKPTKDMRFSEFVYQSFQAYDWLNLYRNHNCCVQFGGHDQLGNIEDGYSFIWKATNTQPNLTGITVPLMVTSNGEKLGKTMGNAVWLDCNKTSLDDIHKYLDELSDSDLRELVVKLTFHEVDYVQDLSHPAMVQLITDEVLALIS